MIALVSAMPAEILKLGHTNFTTREETICRGCGAAIEHGLCAFGCRYDGELGERPIVKYVWEVAEVLAKVY